MTYSFSSLKTTKEEEMAYPAQAIANFFIKKSLEDQITDLNIMKLIKTVFIAHGFYLALHNKPLINEFVQAWKYGPVVEIYHPYCLHKVQNHINFRILLDFITHKIFARKRPAYTVMNSPN